MSHRSTIKLTMAQAVLRYLKNQLVVEGNRYVPFMSGVWAIFGHGNVAGLGEALYHEQDALPTFRGHNEQGMALAAIAYAKAKCRRRAMVCTSSIGPGATNMVTAAALAHVNRLPVLFLPGDVFANRRPDPVLQQIEDFADGSVTANDCFRPVSRYFDRITRPEQILTALPQAMRVMTNPAQCGPATLALCQDVQAEAFEYPESFFEPRVWSVQGPAPHADEIEKLADKIRTAKKPLIVAGGGVHYASATTVLHDFVEQTGIPVGETQAGKGALKWDHTCALGSIGVTGSSAANTAASEADLVIGLGTRLQDFTTASWSLFESPKCEIVQVNVNGFDGVKHGSCYMQGDARLVLEQLSSALQDYSVAETWASICAERSAAWDEQVELAIAPSDSVLPSDAQVVGGVMRSVSERAVVVCAAGGLPGELHKLWRTSKRGGYHVEYGYSCMGYEIAGGIGVTMALPDRDVYVMVGDGSYLMMNSEIAAAVGMGLDLNIIVLDNRGFGCINRLQQGTGGAPFNNLLGDTNYEQQPNVDFAKHAESMGANAQKVSSVAELEDRLHQVKAQKGVFVTVIDTDPMPTTEAGGAWWDVAVPEVSQRESVNTARSAYLEDKKKQN